MNQIHQHIHWPPHRFKEIFTAKSARLAKISGRNSFIFPTLEIDFHNTHCLQSYSYMLRTSLHPVTMPFDNGPKENCISIKVDGGSKLSNGWHYHPEIELVWMKHSAGTRIVGSSVEPFNDNDLILIGKNIPHAFLHEEIFLQQRHPVPEAITIHFQEHFLGKEFLHLAELSDVQQLLVKAQQGLCITDVGKTRIKPLLENIVTANAFSRILLLLEILKILTEGQNYRLLIATAPCADLVNTAEERFNKVLAYTYQNFDRHISLDAVARVTNLTKESFCRYFKSQAGKTYIEFLTEYRISRACGMIREGYKTIKEIGYACGFDSLSNFYHQFKKITASSPLEFRQMHEHVLEVSL